MYDQEMGQGQRRLQTPCINNVITTGSHDYLLYLALIAIIININTYMHQMEMCLLCCPIILIMRIRDDQKRNSNFISPL